MRTARLQELEEMGAKLQATARKLPSGPDRFQGKRLVLPLHLDV
jgi:hypothetical protein